MTLPLVMLHGWSMNLRVFDSIIADIGANRPILRFDLPGHGQRPWGPRLGPARAATLQDFADVLCGELPPRCVLLGWSLGAQVAMQLASQQPKRIEKLVLVSATPRFLNAPDWPLGRDTASLAAIRDAARKDPVQMQRDFLDLQLRGSPLSDERRAALTAALLEQGTASPGGLMAGLDVLEHSDLRSTVLSIAAPTLLIAGRRDRITPSGASEWLAQQLPRARNVELPRAAHAPFLSHHKQFCATLRDFLTAS